jgi:pimeloyl-ACP methyl ester carboxylesterase
VAPRRVKSLPLAVALASAAAAPAGAAEAPKAEFAASCDVAGASRAAKCGIVRVAEDRSRAGGRQLALAFTLVPGDRSAERRDPILVIPGGPGQSGALVLPLLMADLRAIAGGRDILFLDQRGTGGSNPLDCKDGFEVLNKGPGSSELAACLAALNARADLRHYGSAEAVEDIDAVRGALGYERINLVAASYGVRVASAYMRGHPERVRTALLRAAYAPDYNILRDGIGNADAELGRVLDECKADRSCGAAFPRLEARLNALDERLAKTPARIEVDHPGGGKEEIRIGRELFQQMLYAMLLAAPTRQMLPAMIDTASRRGFQPLAPLVVGVRDALYGTLPVGMYLSVVCNEDSARLRREDLPRGRTPLTEAPGTIFNICAAWPQRSAPASLFGPLNVAVPTLILSGTLDPATTVEAANRLAAMLPRARHIVFEATAHGPFIPGCAVKEVAGFVESASPEGAVPNCSALKLAPFTLPARPVLRQE